MMHSNADTEAAVLGALLSPQAQALIAKAELVAEDFSLPGHRAYFHAISTLTERNRPVTPATVWALSASRPGVDADGSTNLEVLALAVRDEAEVLALASELRRLRHLRQLTAFHQEQLELLKGNPNPAAMASVLDTVAKSFLSQEQGFGFGDADHVRIAEEWEQAGTGVRKGFLPTGVDALDEVIMGWEENLNVIGGASSAGKSSLIATSVLKALQAGHRIGFFGLEDGTKWLAKRFVSLRTGIPLKAVGKVPLEPAQWAQVGAVQAVLSELGRNLVCWRPVGGIRLGAEELLAKCRSMIHRFGVRALFVDHGLEIEYGERADDKRHRIDRTFSQLRTLAWETHTPIVVVVHFNREGSLNDGEPPRQEHFAECASIERLSRLSLGLWTSPHDADDEFRCTVMKQTEGRRSVHLVLKRHVTAAMVREDGGREVDLRKEKREIAAAARAAKKAAAPVTNGHAQEKQEPLSWDK